MAGTRAKALARCKQPMGTGATAVMPAVCRQVRLLMVRTFIYSGHVWRGGVGYDEGGPDKMSAGRRCSPAFWPASRDCSS
jgi:hypothetical protein